MTEGKEGRKDVKKEKNSNQRHQKAQTSNSAPKKIIDFFKINETRVQSWIPFL